jgi:translation initiation factor 3 subunit E
MIEDLFSHAKLQMDAGFPDQAVKYLSFYRDLSDPESERSFTSLWGLLAASIVDKGLQMGYDISIVRHLDAVKMAIDERSNAPVLVQLQQRSWLLHWSMFVFFNLKDPTADGCSMLVDFCLRSGENYRDNEYLQAIQVNCPWLLRYLTAAVISCGSGSSTSKDWSTRNVLRDLVKVIQHEKAVYSDPITEFVEALHVDFNFDAAQEKLKECEVVLRNDFFFNLGSDNGEAFIANFIEKARSLIFETFCQIHSKVDISNLALKLNMKPEETEKWMVNMIRNSDLDAKIDSEKNTVVMNHSFASIHQQIIEKTKDICFHLSYRSGGIFTNVNKGKFYTKNT